MAALPLILSVIFLTADPDPSLLFVQVVLARIVRNQIFLALHAWNDRPLHFNKKIWGKTSFQMYSQANWSPWTCHLHMKNKKFCNKTRSPLSTQLWNGLFKPLMNHEFLEISMHSIEYCINSTEYLMCLWSKIIRKASSARHKTLFSWKVNFLSFKKRPNINLSVGYSRTLMIFESSKFAKTTKF